MSPKALRSLAAALLLASLACLAPSPVYGLRRPSGDGPARMGPARGPAQGFIAFLLHLFDFVGKSGGAMDPNG